MRWLRALLHAERGFGPVETAVIVVPLLLIVAMGIGAARISSATTLLDSAALSAARAASISRTAGEAEGQARETAANVLSTKGLKCSPEVTVDTSGFGLPPGEPAQVRVDVLCDVPLSDLGLPGAPGTKTMRASYVSAIDTYREREG